MKNVSSRESEDDELETEVIRLRGLIRYERQLPVRQFHYLCGELKEPILRVRAVLRTAIGFRN